MLPPTIERDHVLFAATGTLGTILAIALLAFPLNLWAILLVWLMSAISISDARRFIVPDILSLPAIPAGLLASGYYGGMATNLLLSPANLAAMAAGAAAFLAIRQGYMALRGREGIGLGDVKLAAVAGAWTGPEGLLHVVLIASLTAIVGVIAMMIRQRADSAHVKITATTALPFGAFLAPSIWLVFMAQSIT